MLTRSRVKIAAVWLLGSAALSAAFATLTVLYWQYTYSPATTIGAPPIQELASTLAMMPLGWALSFLLPFGWINLGGLIWALKRQSLQPLGVSGFTAALFGLFWPHWFAAMMGV